MDAFFDDGYMLKEYDFSKGERGKFATRYAQGTNLVILAPGLVKHFPDSESVNNALRDYLKRRGQTSKKIAS
ncbi:MAG: hypothetical protein HYY30_09425 [Chloroflexi bacterium]|nr:hypothetical protein [Chloroflexota bacterium]